VWFDCSAHRIHCEGVVRNLPFVAPSERRLAADYRDPTSVLRTMAELYPRKLIWGSDTPFQSYVAKEQGRVLALRSTYEEEVACLRALSDASQRAIGHDNLLALLRLKNPEILASAV
jgi:predicted TIM-barrel fold metal-dependent hydrolase